MQSLRTRISLLTLCVTAVAVIVVALTSVLFIQNTEHRKSDQLLLLLCETGERNLDYYFTSVEQSVRKMASYTERDLDGLDDEHLAAHTRRVQDYFDRISGKTNGVLTYYYRIDPAVSGTVKGFWFTNLDGKEFVEHEPTDISQYDTNDTSQLVWFTVPKATGKGVWLPPYLTDNLDNVEVLSYNVPIYYRGQFVGVIGIEIDHSTMAEQVSSIKLYSDGYAFLTDGEGQLIYHPRIDMARKAEAEIPPLPKGLVSESTFTKYTFEGVEREAAWMQLTNGMRLYVSVPVAETEGDWQHLINRILIVGAVVMLLAAVITRIFTGNITKPLQQLTEAAKRADEGNYDFTLDYNGNDEVGVLTRTFKHMADHMKEHISDLNRRANVDALTSVRNKGAFMNYLEDMQAKLDEGAESPEFAIAVFDCDDLKTVNDRYGHDKGDIYLKTASRVICKVFQHSPVFRIGGDEFAAILRNDDFRYREELFAAFEKATAAASAATENLWEQVSVAYGLAEYDPSQDHSVTDTMRRADSTMYVNKRRRKQEKNG